MHKQLNLTLPFRTALGRDDFFVSPANAMAIGLIDSWPNWPSGKLVLAGAAGSGKTHLVHVWATVSQAKIIPATDLVDADIPFLAQGPVAVEDVHAIRGDLAAQKALFHLHNLTLAEGNTLLLTGAADPKHWALELPDLMSRMQGTTVATLDQPDDMLLSVVMAKLFNDRQLMPSLDTIPYLVKHMDRSFETAQSLVAQLDSLSMSEKRPVTRALAKRILQDTL